MKKVMLIAIIVLGSLTSFSTTKNAYKDKIMNYMQKENPKLSTKDAESIYKTVMYFSNKYKVSSDLIFAIIDQESNYNYKDSSSAGAIGLMQIIPATANYLKINPYNSTQNIEGGVRYFKEMLDKYEKPSLALAAYNAGPGAVDKYSGIPPYKETTNYVKKISKIYQNLKGTKSVSTTKITTKTKKVFDPTFTGEPVLSDDIDSDSLELGVVPELEKIEKVRKSIKFVTKTKVTMKFEEETIETVEEPVVKDTKTKK